MDFKLFLNGKSFANVVGDIVGDKKVIKEFGGILNSNIVYSAEIDKKVIISMRMEGRNILKSLLKGVN